MEDIITIITTTVNEPTVATKKFAQIALERGYDFIVVGDKKTPHHSYENMDGVFYFHPDLQEKKYKELSDSIGWNTIQRRNLGFVEAFVDGEAPVIATVDDDNIPYDHWGEDLLVNKKIECDIYNHPLGVFDPLSVTPCKHVWHRGYPLEYVPDRLNVEYKGKALRKVLVQADLWDGDPDIDAMARLTMKPIVKFPDSLSPYGSTNIAPFNSQNTFLSREVIPYYCVLPHVGRMDDIWGSYIMQHYFPNSVAYNKASVYQDRNEQDLIKNLENEILGYRNTLSLIKDLSNWKKHLPLESLNFIELYKKALA
tara:strand:- start:845 stop:1777 length:933 start_codon:yes stop_codon:yes gene_type:complete